MPITWRMNVNWIDVTFTDPYTLDESEATMREIFRQPDLPRPLRLLVDVRNSTPPNTDFVTSAVTFWQLHIDKMWGARIAIVTGTQIQARMAHLSEMTAESRDLPFTLHVFDGADLAEAKRWLENDASPDECV